MTLAWMNEAAYTINDGQRTDLAEVDLADPSAPTATCRPARRPRATRAATRFRGCRQGPAAGHA